MTGEFTVSMYLAAGVGVALTIGFLSPPLTPRGGGVAETPERERTVSQELSYCRASLPDVNCSCFAGKASQILSYDGPEIVGGVRANRTVLARNQAMESC